MGDIVKIWCSTDGCKLLGTFENTKRSLHTSTAKMRITSILNSNHMYFLYFVFRIGRPAAGKELTEEFNVLEAGLWDTISLSKGKFDL
jgi:folate-binding Fe-S cluster repair protein YgfZ